MKKILVCCALAFGLTSCYSLLTQYDETGYVIDYSRYDMFITEATSVNFDYQPVGSVVAFVSSGYQGKEYIEASPSGAVKVLVEEARNVGAYGLMNVKIKCTPRWDTKTEKYIIAYSATGMAIRW